MYYETLSRENDMSETYVNTRRYLVWKVGSKPNPVVDVLALAMGEDLQVELVDSIEADRYALRRVACEVCLSEGATRGMETEEGSTLLCSSCAASIGGVQYERHDDALLPTDGPVVELILSALHVADEVGCGPSEALDILDGAECRVVCGLRQFLPTQRLAPIRSERDDRLAELLGVIVERTDEAAAFLQEQMAAKLRRYAELRASALKGAAAAIRDDLQEKVEARLNAHRMAEDVSAMYRGLEAKLDYLREAA